MFATVYGENATKRLSDVPSAKVPVSDQGGRLRCARDVKTLTAILDVNDVIVMGKLPAGARVHGWRIAVKTASGNGTVKVGWAAGVTGAEAADDDGFGAGVVLDVVGITKEAAANAGYDKKFTEDVDIIVTATEASTAAGVIQVDVEYSLD